MTALDYKAFDADNHYYEAEDAFTRHIDRRMEKRAVRWVEVGGRKRILVGGRLDSFIPNPTFDPVTKPGVLGDYFRGVNPEGKTMAELFMDNIEPIRPEYRDRDARLTVMDEQGLAACILYPTLGCGIEEPLRSDVEATHAALSSFNRWLLEDWGFNYKNRIYTAPMMSLADPERATGELQWAIKEGARIVYLRPAPVPKTSGSSHFGIPEHDPFWALAEESGVVVAFHTADSGYGRFTAVWEGKRQMEGFRGGYAFAMSTTIGRAIMDTMASLIVHGVFARFPGLKVASIENGSFWVPWLFKNFAKSYGQMPGEFSEDPRETFRRHVWVAPFFEDDARELADLIGVEHVIFGSDFPHAEGLSTPLDYLGELAGFSDEEIRLVMRDNARTMLGVELPV